LKYRGKGYGSRLLQFLIRFGKDLGYKYILLDDVSEENGKKNIYIKHGFKVVNDDEEKILYLQ
jgi:GNAT superfamily N-acetyltransferase